MLLSKLRKLFGSRLLAKHGDSGITGDEFNQDRDKRNYGPDNQEENQQASQTPENPIPKRCPHAAEFSLRI
jgi:hypothetical protein